MPKPVNEGIVQFYARKVVERHEIWPQTAVHNREIPERRRGKSDAGTARARTVVLRFLRLKSREMAARASALQ